MLIFISTWDCLDIENNGIDFACKRGTPVFATHSGIITWAGEDAQGGVGVTIKGNGFKTINYHLLSVSVKTGKEVEGGDLIGVSDNTGIYTTGDHLHFGFKEIDGRGNTLNWDNGYRGAIDPSPHFFKNWDKPPVWSGYGQIKIGWGGRKLGQEFMAKAILTKELNRIPTNTEIKAFVYGGWSIEDIKNPNLLRKAIYLTKEQFLNGDEIDLWQ